MVEETDSGKKGCAKVPPPLLTRLCPRLTLLVAVAEEPGSTGVLVTWTFR